MGISHVAGWGAKQLHVRGINKSRGVPAFVDTAQ